MQSKKSNVKKLKTLNSLDTEATYSECNESGLKVSLKGLREPKQNLVTPTIQIVEQQEEQEISRMPHQNDKKLLRVPYISSKQKENSLFDTHHFEQMFESQNQQMMRNMIRNTNKTHDSHYHDMSQTSIIMLVNSESKVCYYNDQEQNGAVQPENIECEIEIIQGRGRQAGYELVPIGASERGGKRLKRATSEFELMQIRSSDEGWKIDKREIGQKSGNLFKNSVKQHKSFYASGQEDQRVGKNQEAKAQPKSKRLKLKDYMYKTEISSKKAQTEKRKQKQGSSKVEQPTICPQRESTTRHTSKYMLNNQQLCHILRKQIEADLNQSVKYISAIKNILNQSQKSQKEPNNGDLVGVFSLREAIRTQIVQKLQFLAKKLGEKEKKESSKHQKSSKVLLK